MQQWPGRSTIPRRRQSEPISCLFSLESRNIRKCQLAAGNMHAAKLGAPVQLWEDLAGIEQAFLVKRAFEALLLVEVFFRKHHRHQITLLDADAVLAGQHAADLDTEPQDVGTEFLRLVELARLVGVI